MSAITAAIDEIIPRPKRRKKTPTKKPRATTTKSPPGDAQKEWKDQIYYDRARQQYLIKNHEDDWFIVNETTLRRQCKVRLGMRTKPDERETASEFDRFVCELQNARGVAYAGPLAGYQKGPRTVNGVPILVINEPLLISPERGDWSIVRSLMEGMFIDPVYDQLTYFYGWLQCALKCLIEGTRKPGQVLVVSGPVESGKSLLQTIVTWLFGGREAKPYAFMAGATDFNSELFGAEHLRLDDEQSHTDMKARRAFGARIKELLFGHVQRLHQKYRDALTLDPLWRMTVTLNQEPESLQVLPMLDDSLEDKLIILRAARKPMPMPTRSTEQSRAFSDKLRSELPAFVHFLLNEFTIPQELENERCGIRHWHHPELLAAIRELSAEQRLLSLIDRELFGSRAVAQAWEGTAEELEHELTKSDSGVRHEASKLLAWNNACGSFLGRLARDRSERVEKSRTHDSRIWNISPPPRH